MVIPIDNIDEQILLGRPCDAVRLDLEETGQPREDVPLIEFTEARVLVRIPAFFIFLTLLQY